MVQVFQCYYCIYGTNDEDDYKHYVVMTHDRSAFPNRTEIEKSGLKPQGKEWET